MTNFISYIRIFIFVIALILQSCGKDDPDSIPETCNRTILVYMVANNSLGNAGDDANDINEMLEASANNTFNRGRLIIYLASTSHTPTLYEISNGQIKALKEYDQSISSVASNRMQEVINDAKQLAPAYDYGLILWSHGSGWLQNGIEFQNNNRSKTPLAFGDDRGKHMNITTLSQVIHDENFSFIYFDCCLMATIEVAYELRHAAPHIIASVTEIPNDGMPYEHNLPLLFADTPNLKGACANTFDFYNCKKGISRSCAISLINTLNLDKLAQYTSQIYELHTSLPENFSPQKFTLDNNCYYFDFAQYINALSIDKPELYNNWQATLNNIVEYKATTPSMWDKLPIEYHCGLSTYILKEPSDSTTHGYNQLQWWTDVASKQWNK